MAGLVSVLSVADLARHAGQATGPLAPPVDPRQPLDPRAARELAKVLEADVRQRFQTGTTPAGRKWRPLKYPRPRGGNQPLRDTARLMNSVTGRVVPGGVAVGTAHPGAAVQNYGAVIRPKKAKHLAIPLTKEAVRAGSPRKLKGTKKVPLFAKKVGGKWVGHFLLVTRATVPAREFMGVSEAGWKAAFAVLGDGAVRKWQQGF